MGRPGRVGSWWTFTFIWSSAGASGRGVNAWERSHLNLHVCGVEFREERTNPGRPEDSPGPGAGGRGDGVGGVTRLRGERPCARARAPGPRVRGREDEPGRRPRSRVGCGGPGSPSPPARFAGLCPLTTLSGLCRHRPVLRRPAWAPATLCGARALRAPSQGPADSSLLATVPASARASGLHETQSPAPGPGPLPPNVADLPPVTSAQADSEAQSQGLSQGRQRGSLSSPRIPCSRRRLPNHT